MSDNRFIRAQGDLLEAAITEASNRKPDSVPTRVRSFLRPRTRTAAVGVALALAVAGCAVAVLATGVLGSSQRLAVGKVDCYYGTGSTTPGGLLRGGSDALVTGATLLAGETPTAFCQQDIKQYSPSALESAGIRPVHNPQLVACEKTATTAAVFIASGAADQCQQLGLKPLPSDFAAASASVRALASQLQKLYLSRDCWQPSAFARVAQQALAEHGFTGWRVVLPKAGNMPNDSPIGLGQCAELMAPNPNSGFSFQSLDGVNRTLDLGLGIPRSLNALINPVDDKLSADLWQRCYSRAGVRALVDQAFASSGMTPRIAITSNPNGGEGFSFGTAAETHHYAHDCPILFESWPTLNDREVLVWLNARNGTYLRPYTGDPPLADFHSS